MIRRVFGRYGAKTQIGRKIRGAAIVILILVVDVVLWLVDPRLGRAGSA